MLWKLHKMLFGMIRCKDNSENMGTSGSESNLLASPLPVSANNSNELGY